MSHSVQTRLKDEGVSLTTFHGGARGRCIQITRQAAQTGHALDFEHVYITRYEALRMAQDLVDFANCNEVEID